MTNIKNPLNKKIKIALLDSGINQTKLAKELGITRQSLSEWLSSSANPKIDYIRKIAKITGKPLNYFFDKSPIITGDNNTVNSKVSSEKDIIIMQQEIALMKKDIENINLRMQILEGKKKRK